MIRWVILKTKRHEEVMSCCHFAMANGIECHSKMIRQYGIFKFSPQRICFITKCMYHKCITDTSTCHPYLSDSYLKGILHDKDYFDLELPLWYGRIFLATNASRNVDQKTHTSPVRAGYDGLMFWIIVYFAVLPLVILYKISFRYIGGAILMWFHFKPQM